MLKQNNFFIGFFFSLALAAFTGLLVWLLAPVIAAWFTPDAPSVKMMLLSVVPPVLLMRWYLRTLRAERAGMGAVSVVFVIIILYFLLLDGNQFFSFVP